MLVCRRVRPWHSSAIWNARREFQSSSAFAVADPGSPRANQDGGSEEQPRLESFTLNRAIARDKPGMAKANAKAGSSGFQKPPTRRLPLNSLPATGMAEAEVKAQEGEQQRSDTRAERTTRSRTTPPGSEEDAAGKGSSMVRVSGGASTKSRRAPSVPALNDLLSTKDSPKIDQTPTATPSDNRPLRVSMPLSTRSGSGKQDQILLTDEERGQARNDTANFLPSSSAAKENSSWLASLIPELSDEPSTRVMNTTKRNELTVNNQHQLAPSASSRSEGFEVKRFDMKVSSDKLVASRSVIRKRYVSKPEDILDQTTDSGDSRVDQSLSQKDDTGMAESRSLYGKKRMQSARSASVLLADDCDHDSQAQVDPEARTHIRSVGRHGNSLEAVLPEPQKKFTYRSDSQAPISPSKPRKTTDSKDHPAKENVDPSLHKHKARTPYLGTKEPFNRSLTSWQDTFVDFHGSAEPQNVLRVSGVCKSLVEADFIRTLIPGWRSNNEWKSFARVIPVRDRYSLEKTDYYLIVFRNPADLVAWRSHLEHLYKLSNKYTMKSLMHPIVPPQEGFVVKGEKIDQIVKSFSLVPAGSVVYANYNPVHKPDDARQSADTTLARMGGYPGIVSQSGHRRYPVMLRISGVRDLQITDVLQAIMYDGEVRNSAWKIILNHPGRLSSTHQWNDNRAVTEDSSSARLDLDASRDERVDEDGIEAPRMVAQSAADSMFEEDIGGMASLRQNDDLRPSANAYKIHDGQRWLIYFHTNRDAQVFARTWHHRPFPFAPLNDRRYTHSQEATEILERDEGHKVKVSTEVLW